MKRIKIPIKSYKKINTYIYKEKTMKNIVILGASRSGKTTLAREICKIYSNYHIINGDSIQNAFEDTLPQNKINNYGGEGMKEDFARFCGRLFRDEINRNKGFFNYIFDSCDVSVENSIKFFMKDDTIIIYMGYTNINKYDVLNNYRKYEQPKDWTINRTDEELLIHVEEWIKKSKIFKNDCEKNGIKYIDTSYNRDEVINQLKKELVEKLLLE